MFIGVAACRDERERVASYEGMLRVSLRKILQRDGVNEGRREGKERWQKGGQKEGGEREMM